MDRKIFFIDSGRHAGIRGFLRLSAGRRQKRAKAVSKEEAVQDVEAIVLSIPFAKYPDVAPLFNNVPEATVVIDTSNYYPFRERAIADIDGGKPESVWVSEQIGRPVVKAFNAVLAVTLAEKGQPSGASGRIAVPVAGDDPEAKAVAAKLVDATGFDPVDSVGLLNSWRQQPSTPAYCTELTTSELKAALQSADKARAPENREALLCSFASSLVTTLSFPALTTKAHARSC
ncbi:NADPH-dependent F420 reductase [Phyllobacterium sp. A18/5-2]|uniref:NADPH-dependent F420 reductase n=1 Tax=Phyllobacterium sp. A18/5-2 TaxID=2978392 RepID=UPI0021C9BC4D|nr:NAD(P)-binding domain-containing protein [Phyllobacterium sp. A18/5-2]